MNIARLFVLILLAGSVSCGVKKGGEETIRQVVDNSGEIRVATRVIHPKTREWAGPAGGVVVDVNPPSMMWPVDKSGAYQVRLSQDPDFRGEAIESGILPYAMYNPHRKLDDGVWHWQYKTAGGPWSDTHVFRVEGSSRDFETPGSAQLLSAIPVEHPRVLVRRSELEKLRKRVGDSPEARAIIAEAEALLSLPVIEEAEVLPTFTGSNARETRRIAIDAARPVCERAQNVVSTLAQAYLLTGEERFAQAGERWIMSLAGWDPEGASRVSDFGDSGIMHAMAVGYDTFYDRLTGSQKSKLLQAIAARAKHFYDDWLNYLEARLLSNHVWQHILERFFQTALAVKGDLPEADAWLTYCYEIWLAKAPRLGYKDGAWSNGVSYFRMNMLTMLSINTTLQELTGVDFMQDEWYFNNPEWLIYAFPPKGAPDAFCNDGYRYETQTPLYIAWADLLGRITGNAYARWYADQSIAGTDKTLTGDESLRWFYLRRGLTLERPAPLTTFALPQARVFREVGVAYLHTDLANTPSNFMLALKSSPYGSYSHTHAEHNCFNLFYGGQPLFSNTGYRPAMGDPHYLADYKNTRGHNGILIDDKGQPFGSEAYGWIPRFLDGEQISYVVGDATNAYDATDADELEEPGNPYRNHRDAGLKRFRRHIALLRPSTLIVYDELETEAPARFTFMLHSRRHLNFDADTRRLSTQNEYAAAQSMLFASTDIEEVLTDQFALPPENWRQKETPDGELLEYVNHHHYRATNKEKTDKMRFLAIIQLEAEENGLSVREISRPAKGEIFTVGDWEIEARLDTSRPAFLSVRKGDATAAFCSSGVLEWRDKNYRGRVTGSAKLAEVIEGKPVFQEAVDELPASIEQVIREKRDE